MADKWWKDLERRVAAFFGTTRTPLSGGNGKQTRSDTLHPDLFVEVKGRERFAAVSLWRRTAELAKKEGKIPVVVLAEKGRHGFFLLVYANDIHNITEVIGSVDSNQANANEKSTVPETDVPAVR